MFFLVLYRLLDATQPTPSTPPLPRCKREPERSFFFYSTTHTPPSLQTRARAVFSTTTHTHFSLAANASRRSSFLLLNYTPRPLPRCKREPEGFSGIFFIKLFFQPTNYYLAMYVYWTRWKGNGRGMGGKGMVWKGIRGLRRVSSPGMFFLRL